MNIDVFSPLDKEYPMMMRHARDAERSVKVSPYSALANARTALESLCNSLLAEIKKDPSRVILTEGDGSQNLSTKINTCFEAPHIRDAAHSVRKTANEYLHDPPKKDGPDMLIVNGTTVEIAETVVRDLYKVMCHVFPDISGPEAFDELKIPFGGFDIIRAVRREADGTNPGCYNYFVRDPHGNCSYLQIISRNSLSPDRNELGARQILTDTMIRSSKKRKQYVLPAFYPSILLPGSEWEYVAYPVFEDSLLLSELNSPLSEKDAVRIALDLVRALCEMGSVAGWSGHRNIQPRNVIITPADGHYRADLINTETAKLRNADRTVMPNMRELLRDSFFLPPSLRNLDPSDDVSWERADMYSVGKIMMYCLNKDRAESDDPDTAYALFRSDRAAGIAAAILDESSRKFGSMKELERSLCDAKKSMPS